jgi:tetratricopeptide (TPR) repeat protein
MGRISQDRIVRRLDEAEGYLMLDLPERALGILRSRAEWATMQFEASFLTGEALRRLGRFREALGPLERAAGLRPSHVGVAIALGWCYKRTHRIAQAIDALERAAREAPDAALLHYNLACYWSLAGNPPRAVDALATALDLDPKLRERIAAEADFNTIRGNPEFDRIAYGREPSA